MNARHRYFFPSIPPKTLSALVVSVFLLFLTGQAAAQPQPPKKRLHITVFVPLYLDSAWDPTTGYRYGKSLPVFMNPGLETYLGLQAALDSLTRDNAEADIRIYDSRSPATSPETLLKADSLSRTDLILGHVNVNEAALLARYAQSRNIPFVNMHLPNEAGSINNPYHILLNPTLNAHCQGIYRFLQQHFATVPAVLLSRTGNTDQRIRNYFREAETNSASVPLNMTSMNISDSLDGAEWLSLLDSTRLNVWIIASLDLNFSMTICRQLSERAKTYPIMAVGMPNWESIDFFKKPCRGIDLAYGNSVHIAAENRVAQQLQQQLKARYFTRTTENTYRAYESLLMAGHLKPASGPELLKQLQQVQDTPFGQWEIKPVSNKAGGQTDYQENRKIYFIVKRDGNIKMVY